jgi:1-acyl-sn-glycerol-3-phosphate acyltransferase
MSVAQLPEIVLDNSDDVYEYYLAHQQNRLKAKAAYAILARRYRPRVTFAPGARKQVRELVAAGRRLIVAVNHRSEYDPYTVAAMAWRSPLRPVIGRTRVLAKDELFIDPDLRRKVEMMGAIPVFRGKDHGVRAANAAGQRMIDVCAERLRRGDDLAVFPEGTCNETDPTKVQAVGTGVAHIAFRAHKLGVDPVAVFVGLSYGDVLTPSQEQVKGAGFYFHTPVTTLPTKLNEITAVFREGMQAALDGAVARY